MGYGARIRALWQAAADQDGEQMARFFTEDAVILWPNTNERFTASEYIRANCAYPGQWQGQVERAAPDGSSSVARVWNRAGEAFRAVSFYRWEGDRISRLEEYWGDTAPAPAWRQAMGLGAPVREGDLLLPAPLPMGRCGFCCGLCPDWRSGACAGCRDAHAPGDCFTRDCTAEREIPFCPLCGEFPCVQLLERQRATVLDPAWLRWKRREQGR